MQAQIDGSVIKAKFTLPQRQKVSSPQKAVTTGPKREALGKDDIGAPVEKDGHQRKKDGNLAFHWENYVTL